MQRIATLAVCVLLWNPQGASATGCDTIGDLVGGFAAGAAGYGLMRNLGPTSSWISAGLYGAGIAAATVIGDDAAEAVCEDFEDILYRIAEIYCIAGEFHCGAVHAVTRSLMRDFQICPSCRTDEILGAFFMEDGARRRHLGRIQRSRGWLIELSVLPRNQLGPFQPSIVDSYFAGLQAGFDLQRALQRYTLAR